jgi:hypothetical protein
VSNSSNSEFNSWARLPNQHHALDNPATVKVEIVAGHDHFWERAFSRRNFITGAAGATGLAVSSGLGLPAALMHAQTGLAGVAQSCSSAPKPIRGGIQPFGPGTEVFHVFAPPGPGTEPSTITDFEGAIGVAVVHGNGTGSVSGKTSPLFYSVDVRFMKGAYLAEDGNTHEGTFAFTWFDLFEGQGGPQVHDFSYGITTGGLFWTTLIQPESVNVNLASASASLCLGNTFVIDAQDLVNGLRRGPVLQAGISFKYKWLNPTTRGKVRDTHKLFDLSFVNTSAQLEWTASNEKGFTFQSGAASSVTDFAELGNEQNGAFFV